MYLSCHLLRKNAKSTRNHAAHVPAIRSTLKLDDFSWLAFRTGSFDLHSADYSDPTDSKPPYLSMLCSQIFHPDTGKLRMDRRIPRTVQPSTPV